MNQVEFEWRMYRAGTTRKAPCGQCGVMSSWHPKGWAFRYVPTPGGDLHGSKVKTDRRCPKCFEQMTEERNF